MTTKEAVDLYRHAYKKANDTQEGIDELTLALDNADKAVEAPTTKFRGLSRNKKIALVGGGGALTAGLAALLYGLKKKKQKPVKK